MYGTSTGTAVVQGNIIGADATGSRGIGNARDGIDVSAGQGIQIGGMEPGAGNLLSGNGGDGIDVFGTATGSILQHNFIGTDASGLSAIANNGEGIYLGSGSNLVGGTLAAARNVVSGNGSNGLRMSSGTPVGNVIEGNYFGVDVTGTRAWATAATASTWRSARPTWSGVRSQARGT